MSTRQGGNGSGKRTQTARRHLRALKSSRRWALALITLAAALCAGPMQAKAQTRVAIDWALKPTAIGEGGQFRLIFATSGTRSGESANIEDYNTFVQQAAQGGHAAIQTYASQFRVVGCTTAVNAIANTSTAYTTEDTGVPIYWLNGPKVADDYEDFYDGTWDDEGNPKNESGTNRNLKPASNRGPITGCGNDGTTHNVGGSGPLGATGWIATGAIDHPRAGENPLIGSAVSQRSDARPMYALSPVFEATTGNATGKPGITGTPQAGQTLTANAGDIADEDGLPSTTFPTGYELQWVGTRSGSDTEISGATGQTYTVQAADVGATLKVRVKFTDGDGTQETVTSEETQTVVAEQEGCTARASDDWCSTIIVEQWDSGGATLYGYDGTRGGLFNPTITEGSTSYTIGGIWLFIPPGGTPGLLIESATGNDRVPRGWRFNIGGTGYTTTSGTEHATFDRRHRWNIGDDVRWLDGQLVTVSVDTDGGRPKITEVGVTSKANPNTNIYGLNGKIEFTVTFSEAVEIVGTPHFEFSLGPVGGGEIREAAYASGSGTTKLVFSYTVQADDRDPNGIWIGDGDQTLMYDPGEGIRSVSTGNEAVREHATVGTRPGHKVDGSMDNNTPATGKPGITGVTQQGKTLTATKGSIDDFNGEPANFPTGYEFQWIRVSSGVETEIGGAESQTYTLQAADAGKTVKVQVSFTDNESSEETLTSDESATILAGAEDCAARTGAAWCTKVTVEEASDGGGTAWGFRQGTYGSIVDREFTVDSTTYRMERVVLWRSGSMTPSSHAIVQSTNNKMPHGWAFNFGGRVFTTSAAAEHATVARRYQWTRPAEFSWIDGQDVTISVNVPTPNATGKPEVTGTAQARQTLTASLGTISDPDGLPSGTFPANYDLQWVRATGGGDTDIAGAESASYTITDADVDATLKVRVEFTDQDGVSESLESDVTLKVLARAEDCSTRTANEWCTTMTVGTREDAMATTYGYAYGTGGFGALEDPDVLAGIVREFKGIALREDNLSVLVEPAVPQYTLFNIGGVTFEAGTGTAVMDMMTRYIRMLGETVTWREGQLITVSANLAPVIESAYVTGKTLTLEYPENMDTDSIPAASAWTVTVNGTTVNVSSAAYETIHKLNLTLESSVVKDDVVTISYEAPSTNPLQEQAGVKAENVTDRNVQNFTEGPSIGSIEFTSTPSSNGFYVEDNIIKVTVTFSETVEVTGNPELTINFGGRSNEGTRTATYAAGESSGSAVVFTYTVVEGDKSSTNGISIAPNSFELNGGTVEDTSDNAAVLEHEAIPVAAGHKVDAVPPELLKIQRASEDNERANAARAVWLVSFSEKLENMTAADFSVDGTDANITLTSADGGHDDETLVQASLSGNDIAMLEEVTVTLTLAAGQDITDLAGNPLANTTPTQENTNTFVIDNTAPVVASAAGSGTSITIAFNEDLDEELVPDASAFTVKKTPQGGSEQTVTVSGTPTVAGKEVELTLAAAIADTDTGVKVSYTKSGIDSNKNIHDLAGNEAGSFTDRDVNAGATPDTTAPTIESIEITSEPNANGFYVEDNAIEATVTFTETVDVTGTPTLALNFGGSIATGSRAATYSSVGSAGKNVVFSYTVVDGDLSVTSGIAVLADSIALNGGTIRDGSSNAAVLTHAVLGRDTDHKVDAVDPTVIIIASRGGGKAIQGNEVSWNITFSEDVENIDADDFAHTGTSAVLRVGAGAVNSEGQEVFSIELTGGDINEINGTVAISFKTSQDITDLAGNALTETEPTGRNEPSQVVDNTKPEPEGASASGTTLRLTFNEELHATGRPPNSAFTVRKTPQGGAEQTVALSGTAAISDKTVTLTLAAAIARTDTGLNISYAKPSNIDQRIQDIALNQADAFTRLEVYTRPGVQSVELTSEPSTNGFYVEDDVIEVTVTFTHPVTVTGAPVFTLDVGYPRVGAGTNERSATYDAAKSDGQTVVFTYQVKDGEESSSLGIGAQANAIALSGGTIRDTGNNDADLSHSAVAPDAAHRMDSLAPTLKYVIALTPANAETDIAWSITFSEEVTNITDDDFTLSGTNATFTVSSQEVNSVNETEIVIEVNGGNLGTLNGDITLGFAPTQNIADLAGNPFTETTPEDPNRLVITVDNTPPTLVSANASGTSLTLTYDEELDTSATSLANSAFTVKKTPFMGTEQTVTLTGTPTIAGRAVRLTTASQIANTDTNVKVSYTTPDTDSFNRIRDEAGNDAADFTDRAVEIGPSGIATLDALELSANGATVPLDPAFDLTQTTYTAGVADDVAQVTFTATKSHEEATIVYRRGTVVLRDADTADGFQANVGPGANPISIEVTAQDTTTKQTYSVTITRARTNVCRRTPAVRDAIVAEVAGKDDCVDITRQDLQQVVDMDLSGAGTGALKEIDFEGLTGLQMLDLSGNNLDDLPGGFDDDLRQVRGLNLSQNGLTGLYSRMIADMGELRLLHAIDNDIEEIEAGALDTLTKLNVLELHYNDLGRLPDGLIDNNPALTQLALNNNKLTGLPQGLTDNNPALTRLEAQENDIEALHAGMLDNNEELTTIDLSSNELEHIPDDMFAPTAKLTTLVLDTNPGAPFSPTMEAGPDQTVTSGQEVTLEGSAIGPWGERINWAWIQVDAQGSDTAAANAVALTGGDAQDATFTAPPGTSTLHFRLSGGPHNPTTFRNIQGTSSARDWMSVKVESPTDATLAALEVEGADGTMVELKPAFSAAETEYDAQVRNEVEGITLKVEPSVSGATVQYLDEADAGLADLDGNADGHQVALDTGQNTLKVRVRSADRSRTMTYTLVVTRQHPHAAGDLRLLGPDGTEAADDGSGVARGRVEVFFRNQWGTICDDRFTSPSFTLLIDGQRVSTPNIAPALACQLMGYDDGYVRSRSQTKMPRADEEQPIWLDDLRCSEEYPRQGNTTNPAEPLPLHRQCYHAGVGIENCSHSEDVHLECVSTDAELGAFTAELLLADETLRHNGHDLVEVYLVFNEPADIDGNGTRLSREILQVTGGTLEQLWLISDLQDFVDTVNGAQDVVDRLGEHAQAWGMRVRPETLGTDVHAALVPDVNAPCEDNICTSDGRALSSESEVTIATKPRLTMTFSNIPAEAGMATSVTLGFSEPVTPAFTLSDSDGFYAPRRSLRTENMDITGIETDPPGSAGHLKTFRITFTVEDTARPVSIELRIGSGCGYEGVPCTSDGRMVSNPQKITIPGTDIGAASTEEGLNAEFQDVPNEHDGTTDIVFTVVFNKQVYTGSESIDKNKAVRDALEVTGATVKGSWRPVRERFDAYAIRLGPSGPAPITLRLAPQPGPCTAASPTCTPQGERLGKAIEDDIEGPAKISITGASVEEGPGAVLEFSVALSRDPTRDISVMYATSDGEAEAGADYVAQSGTLVFRAGETTKKIIEVEVLDDAHDEEEETMKVTLSQANGGYIEVAEAVGTITNSDLMPAAWLARAGRLAGEHITQAAKARMTGARGSSANLKIAGIQITGTPDRSALEAQIEAEQARREWERAAHEDGSGLEEESHTFNASDLLLGTSFSLSTERPGGTAGAWAHGASTRFTGTEGALSIEGDVSSAMLGADWATERWTLGAMLSHSRAEGSYSGEGAGTVESDVTGLYPYASRTLSERLTLWGVAGYGTGTLTLTPEGKRPIETGMDLAMGSLGLRATLRPQDAQGAPEIAAIADAMGVRTTSDAVEATADNGGNMAAAEALVTRLRAGVEGRWTGLEIGALTLSPTLEVAVRNDAGDAETGTGLDLAAGLAWESPATGLSGELRARALAVHEADGLREKGFSGSISYDPRPQSELGLSIALRQALGTGTEGGMDALFGHQSFAALDTGQGEGATGHQIELDVGYGMPAFGGRFTATPHASVRLAGETRGYALGWRLARSREGEGSVELRIEATRQESTGGAEGDNAVRAQLLTQW